MDGTATAVQMMFILGVIVGGVVGIISVGLASANSFDDGYRQAIEDCKNCRNES